MVVFPFKACQVMKIPWMFFSLKICVPKYCQKLSLPRSSCLSCFPAFSLWNRTNWTLCWYFSLWVKFARSPLRSLNQLSAFTFSCDSCCSERRRLVCSNMSTTRRGKMEMEEPIYTSIHLISDRFSIWEPLVCTQICTENGKVKTASIFLSDICLAVLTRCQSAHYNISRRGIQPRFSTQLRSRKYEHS